MRRITFGVLGLGVLALSGVVVLGQAGQQAQRIVHATAKNGEGFYFTKEQIMEDVKKMLAGGQSTSLTVLEGGHYSINIVHRRGPEQPQWHREDVDMYIIQEGTATMITGGELVGPVVTAADGDKRGASIKGGVSRTVKPGDIVFIPPGTPHQGVFNTPTGVTYVNVHWPGNYPGGSDAYPPPLPK